MSDKGQKCIFDVLFVDSFAGGGGASTGIEMATGHPVDIAINHDESAIMMHKRNHPYTEHYREDIWQVDPIKATRGQHVRLAWFSPDCKHFSRAKGAALVDKHIRGLAWVVLRWAGTVKPDVIMLENVPEFVTWGPVHKGKPIKSKSGQTYRKWHKQLSDLGYQIESRELCAADYGAPTIRTRFCLIARRDGLPIQWPERTHAPADSPEVKSGKCLPWRAAAEIIDWTLPMYSIFDTAKQIKKKYGATARRPLADNTQRRVIRGVDKHTIKSGKPFLVECNHSGDGHIAQIGKPLNTITARDTKGVCDALLAPVTFSNTSGSVGFPADAPVHTITSDGKQVLSTAFLSQYHEEKSNAPRTCGLETPMPTIDASNRFGLVGVNLTEYYGNGAPLDITEPMHTITARDREALVSAILQPIHAGGYHGRGNLPTQPVNTITSSGGQQLVGAHIAKFKGTNLGQTPAEPLQTITAQSNPFALCQTVIQKYDPGADLGRWPQVRALLNKYCDYHLASDEIILLIIAGTAYYIRDILLRMLSPRELYDAMGFPHDYIIDRDVDGREIKREDQVARCGNAVCPAVSEAMVRANLPECAPKKYGTMKALHEAMTA